MSKPTRADRPVSDSRAGDLAASLYQDALVWDMTLPWVPGYTDGETLPRFHAAGIDVVSLTVNDQPGSVGGSVKHLSSVKAYVRAHPDSMVLAGSVDDILRAKTAGKLALILNFQETNPLESSTNLIQIYYDLGVRHMLLAYNQKNAVGDGCAERTDAGLSRFGQRVVEEMNRVGMLVDGTHSGYRTTMEAMELATAPFIFSHCNAYGLIAHYRNIRDDQIKGCAATGGVIGVNGLGEFLADSHAKTESMFDHMDYMVNLVGPAHVGIGLDYVRNTAAFWRWVRASPEAWPLVDGKPHDDTAFAQPEQLLQLAGLMLERGYAEDDVRNILGGNFLRVARQVWK